MSPNNDNDRPAGDVVDLESRRRAAGAAPRQGSGGGGGGSDMDTLIQALHANAQTVARLALSVNDLRTWQTAQEIMGVVQHYQRGRTPPDSSA